MCALKRPQRQPPLGRFVFSALPLGNAPRVVHRGRMLESVNVRPRHTASPFER